MNQYIQVMRAFRGMGGSVWQLAWEAVKLLEPSYRAEWARFIDWGK